MGEVVGAAVDVVVAVAVGEGAAGAAAVGAHAHAAVAAEEVAAAAVAVAAAAVVVAEVATEEVVHRAGQKAHVALCRSLRLRRLSSSLFEACHHVCLQRTSLKRPGP